MANRAYLWTSDAHTPENWDREGPYYDSRWTIPVAWFFLFRPQDVLMTTVTFGGSSWLEPFLMGPKDEAVRRFQRRRPLLARLVGEERFGPKIVDGFVRTVAARPGRHVLLDPHEIAEDDTDFERFRSVAALLDHDGTTADDLAGPLRGYSRLRYNDRAEFRLHVIGATYWPDSSVVHGGERT